MNLINLLNRYRHVFYVDDVHTYTNMKTNTKYQSVTTRIEEYKEEFNAAYWSKYKALKNSGYRVNPSMTIKQLEAMISKAVLKETPEELLEQWKETNIKGVTNGSEIHWKAELMAQNKKENSNSDTITFMLQKFFNDHPNYVTVKTEMIVANDEKNLAGQVDLLVYDIKEDEFIIIDWKTDKKIDYENVYQNLLPPLEDLQDTEINKYGIQLNLYKRIIETTSDIKISKMFIVWLKDTNSVYHKIEIPNMDKYIDRIWQQ